MLCGSMRAPKREKRAAPTLFRLQSLFVRRCHAVVPGGGALRGCTLRSNVAIDGSEGHKSTILHEGHNISAQKLLRTSVVIREVLVTCI